MELIKFSLPSKKKKRTPLQSIIDNEFYEWFSFKPPYGLLYKTIDRIGLNEAFLIKSFMKEKNIRNPRYFFACTRNKHI